MNTKTVILFYIFILLSQTVRTQTPTCTCVGKNNCYQPLSYDGSGAIDIRIVSPGDAATTTTTTTTAAPTTAAPTTTVGPGTCPTGNDFCCTGPGVVGCGLRWQIPPGPSTTPGTGQAKYGSQPWQAILFGAEGFIGGGTLLNPNIVVTAAHKVAGRDKSTLLVRLGEWNASSTTEPYPTQNSSISAVFIHPNYTANNLFNDIAVLRLTTPIIASPVINTLCMPNPNMNFDNLRCLVGGWGKDSYTGNIQNVMREVEVPVVPYADCQTKLRNSPKLGPFFNLDPTSFICAGGEAGKDACIGDGGFALSCIVGGRYYLVGLVAWGIGCGDANMPGVYVKTSSYMNWIQSVISS